MGSEGGAGLKARRDRLGRTAEEEEDKPEPRKCSQCLQTRLKVREESVGRPWLMVRQMMVCTRCRVTFYCDVKCQRAHWPVHKATCVPP